MLAQDPLQGAPVHVEAARRLRDVAIALLEHALDVFPAHAVGGHRVAGRRRQLATVRGQRLLDGVGVRRLGEIVDGPFLHRGDGGGDVAVAGEHDDADVGPRLAQRTHQFESIAVAQPEVENGEGGRAGRLGQGFGDRADRGHDEAAQLQRPRNAIAERSVVVGDQ